MHTTIGGLTKGAAVRLMLTQHPDWKPTHIRAAMAKQGVLVSMPVIYSIRMELRNKTKTPTAAAAPAKWSDLTVAKVGEQLQSIKRLAKSFGGLEKLKELIDCYEKITVG